MIPDTLDFSTWNVAWLAAVAGILVLLLLLLVSFLSRARVFCEYLKHLTGIELRPGTVQALYKKKGRGAVRDHLINLLVQEDLADPERVVTPDSKPDTSMFDAPL